MSDETHKNLLHGIVEALIERADDPELFSGLPHDTGYRLALYYALNLIEGEAKGLLVDPKEIGFGKFSPDEWLRQGRDYRW